MKTIPKSLHTVRVVALFARSIQCEPGPYTGPNVAVQTALARLGYEDADDLHGIRAAALKALAQMGDTQQ